MIGLSFMQPSILLWYILFSRTIDAKFILLYVSFAGIRKGCRWIYGHIVVDIVYRLRLFTWCFHRSLILICLFLIPCGS